MVRNTVSELTKTESPRDHSFNHVPKFTNSGHRAIASLFTLRWQSPHSYSRDAMMGLYGLNTLITDKEADNP